MNIIRTHDITLYGGTDENRIVLLPLSDEHLPLLYKWNADPEILYWTEGGKDVEMSYDEDTVHDIYGGASQNAFCFLVEVNGKPIGECWLQKMNLPNVLAMYPGGCDVRRIDIAIGEKTMWGRGIGTMFMAMLADFAFNGEFVDVLHCIHEDYNIRSRRICEKNGFTLILSEELPQPQKGKLQHHWRLTRREYIELRRERVPADDIFELPLAELQPSQLYISEGKLRLAKQWFDETDWANFDPIPIKQLDGKNVMTDGHTRAALAVINGWKTAPCCYETAELDWAAYAENVRWCEAEKILSPFDLARRAVPHKAYEELWRRRCCEARSALGAR
jgi:RimJ/RimL family protein N-acetyltransferase